MMHKKEAFELYKKSCDFRNEIYDNLAQMLCDTIINSEISREAEARHVQTRLFINSGVFNKYNIPNWDIVQESPQAFGNCIVEYLEKYGYDALLDYNGCNNSLLITICWA